MLYQANSCCLSAKACRLPGLGFNAHRIVHKALYFWGLMTPSPQLYLGFLLVEEIKTFLHVWPETLGVGISYSVCCAAQMLSYTGVGDLNKVSQVEGVRCAPRLKFLEWEPKKCKPSPSCPTVHQDRAVIWLLGGLESVLLQLGLFTATKDQLPRICWTRSMTRNDIDIDLFLRAFTF